VNKAKHKIYRQLDLSKGKLTFLIIISGSRYQIYKFSDEHISLQNFVSALQKRIQLSGTETPSERSIKSSSNERNTSRSDRTHFTTIHDPDSELCDKIEIVRDIG